MRTLRTARLGEGPVAAQGDASNIPRAMRDLAALATLPAIWVDCDVRHSIQNLTDVLRAALRAFTVCVRVELPDGGQFDAAASEGLSNRNGHTRDAAELLDAVESDSTEPVEIAKFNGSGPLTALPQPIFFEGRQIGYFIACYKEDVLPSASDRLLLHVAASQVMLLLQRHKDQEERFARKLAEDRLRQTEHHYQQLVQSLPAAVYTCDNEGRLTLYNEAAVALWGRRPKIGEDLWCGSWKIFKTDGKPLPLEDCPMAISIREGRSVRGQEIIVERPDGTRSFVLPHPDPIRDESGAIIGTVNMLVVVDELKRVEQALRSSEAHLQSLLNLMPAAVYACDAEGRISFYNRRAAKLWGREPTLNDDHQKFCAAYRCWFNGKVLAPEDTPMAMAVHEGKSFRNLEPEFERPDGVRVPVLVNIDPILDADGKPAGAINVFQDVTTLKQTEAELRRKNNQLAAFLDTAALGLHRVGPDGLIQWANAAEIHMLGYTAEEYIGHHVAEFHVDRPVIDDILKRLTCGETLHEREVRLRCKDGSIKHVLIDSSVLWEDGHFIHTQCFTRDVTDRKRAEEALRESQALLEGQKDAFQASMGGCSLEEALDVLVRRVVEFTGGRARAAFYIASPDGKALHHIVGMNEHYANAVDGFPICGDSAACGLAVHTGQPVITPDVEREPKWEAYRWLARHHHFRACWSFPIRTKESPVLGTLAMYFEETCEPTPREMELATVIAHAATVIISRHQQSAERERAEQALRESEEKYRTLFESIEEAFCTVEVVFDQNEKPVDYRFLLVNPAFERQTGIPNATGRSMREIAPLHEEYWFETYGRIALTGEAMRFENRAEQLGRHYEVYAWRIGKPSERKIGILFHDISERKRGEESTSRLAAIIEHSDDGIFSTDLDGAITTWNRGAERLYGYTTEEAVGQPVMILVPEDRREEESAILERIRQGQSTDNYETLRRRKDGTLFDVSLTASPVKDSNGNVIGASKVARDVTDKVRAKEKLEQIVDERTSSLRAAVAQMEEFSYTVSHDLRAPLRGMRVYTDALLQDFAATLPPQANHYLNRISVNANRLDKMILDVLTFSRLARTELRLERVQVDKLVRQIVEQYPGMQAPQAQIQIEPLPDVWGHEPSLTQALSNLLNNAVKFVAPGATPMVKVTSELRGGRVRLWISDNGIGIHPKYHHRLFNMFERMHPNLKYEGTGVGLAIVRKATERMGGNVGIESDGSNGSRFWIEADAADGK